IPGWWRCSHPVGGVENDFAFEARYACKSVGHSLEQDRHQDDVGVAGVTAVTPEHCYVVPGLHPQPPKRPADNATAKCGDFHNGPLLWTSDRCYLCSLAYACARMQVRDGVVAWW